MKSLNLKFLSMSFALPAAMLAMGCSSEPATFNASGSGTVSVANAPGTTTTASATPAPVVVTTPPGNGTGARGGCGPNAPQDPYRAQVSGTGAYTSGSVVRVPFVSNIFTDNVLRVSVKPVSTSQSVSKFGVKVTLKNAYGAVLGTRTLPNTGTDSLGYKAGITVGSLSDPLQADFSSVAGQGSGYIVELSEIKTDWVCMNNMTASKWRTDLRTSNPSTCNYTTDWQGYIYPYNPQNWGYQPDYTAGGAQAYVCQGSLFVSSQKNVCGISNATTNSSWTVDVQVETTSTRCIAN